MVIHLKVIFIFFFIEGGLVFGRFTSKYDKNKAIKNINTLHEVGFYRHR